VPNKLFVDLASRETPSFVTQRTELRLLRRLQGAGYLNVRFFPEEPTDDQFAELQGLTPLGRRVLDIVTRPDGGRK